MPYPHVLPVIKDPVLEGEVPYTIQHPDMPTSWEEMQKSWIQLKEGDILLISHTFIRTSTKMIGILTLTFPNT